MPNIGVRGGHPWQLDPRHEFFVLVFLFLIQSICISKLNLGIILNSYPH
jgi:hypothetical protein